MNFAQITTLVLITALLSCAPVNGQEAVGATTFKEMIASAPGTLVDVRTPDEWKGGVIAGAVLIDFHADGFKERMAALDRNVPVYIYCAVGGRSHLAALQLQKLGHSNVIDLDGGMEAWQEAGYAVVPPGRTGK